METTLQPTSVTKLLVRSYALLFRMFFTFVIMLLVVCVPMILTIGLAFLGAYVTEFASKPVGIAMLVVAGVVFFVVFLGALFYYYAVVTLAVSLRLTGAKAGVWQMLRRCSGKLALQVLSTGFKAGLRVIGGLLLLVVPGLILMVRYTFVQPVVVLERTAGRDALERSKQLGSGHGWRIFGGFVLFELVYLLIYLCITLGGRAAGLSAQAAANLYSLVSFLLFPAGIIFPVLMYYDVRARKEALNLETIREVV